jgi:hypothetical protein
MGLDSPNHTKSSPSGYRFFLIRRRTEIQQRLRQHGDIGLRRPGARRSDGALMVKLKFSEITEGRKASAMVGRGEIRAVNIGYHRHSAAPTHGRTACKIRRGSFDVRLPASGGGAHLLGFVSHDHDDCPSAPSLTFKDFDL